MASKCANPTCSNQGSKQCAACYTVWYCGADCQKSHWPDHRSACKAAKQARAKASPAGAAESTLTSNSSIEAAANAVPTASRMSSAPQSPTKSTTTSGDQSPKGSQIAGDVVMMRLQSIKSQTQAAFQSGDFMSSIRLGNEALSVANMITEPGKSIETIQIHLNIASAYLQMGKVEEADVQNAACVEAAEKAVAIRNNHPQAIDMLHVTLFNRAIILLNRNKLDEAEACGVRALQLAEAIFPPGDVRLFKPLRALGLVKGKQEKNDEADQFLKRAYICTMKGNGVCHGDTQTIVDDLMQFLMRRKDLPGAEKFAKKNYDSMVESGVSQEHPLFGEACAKYASVLANMGREAEADPFMVQALKAREKAHGPNSHAAAVTLMALANIREACNNVSEETERLLLRALEIFKAVEGPQSPHVLNAIAFIRRVHTKRESSMLSTGPGGKQVARPVARDVELDSGDDSDQDGVVTSESKHKPAVSSSSSGAHKSSSSSSQVPAIPSILPRSDDGKPVPRYPPDDGASRMRQSAYYFETAQYWKAEVLLQEAYQIFLRQDGPTHQNTLAAKQNLAIVKHNSVNQLWHEVVAEQLESLRLADNDDGTTSSATSKPKDQRDVTAIFQRGVTKPSGDKVSAQDSWLYEEPKASSGCVIA